MWGGCRARSGWPGLEHTAIVYAGWGLVQDVRGMKARLWTAPREGKMVSRREFGRIALAALPLAAAKGASRIDSKVAGVQLGAQSYSFRERPMDKAIEAYKEVGLGECELWQGHVEPEVQRGQDGREELRKWRLTTPLDRSEERR